MDILNSDRQLLFAIQLKNLSSTLTLSNILSDSKTSFVKRFLETYPDAIPILVSYGKISDDLLRWKAEKDRISKNDERILQKFKITKEDWALIKAKTEFTEVNEEQIAYEVEQMMKKDFSLIDPIPTIGFLLNWLQYIAEKQQPITIRDVYSKIEDFAQYITQRIAIHNQHGVVLKSLHKISTENSDKATLEKEFYNATLTRYEHILSGLDVNREQYLKKINQGLKESNTLILRGASGQGKTALLYSYVHRFASDWLSFELNIQQDPVLTQHAIQGIASISKKLDIPTVFIVNVIPNSTEWVRIVKESAHLKHIKFLVAIRNEDWYRASAIGVEFEHQEIALSLSRQEADSIYAVLNKRRKIVRFSDFEQAWIQLGDDVPLLEFIYSITQGESLHNKLKQQVRQLASEAHLGVNHQIEFLRMISLADAAGAKIEVSKLDSNIDYQFIIEKLENEYLIKKSSDRKYIQGLHLVRSQKLVEILFDEFTNHKEDYGYRCIPLVADEDLYLFLLQQFHQNIFTSKNFINELGRKIPIPNWAVYASTIKSLIWLGTRDYVETNRNVIDECRAAYGSAWSAFTNFLFNSGHDINHMLNLLGADEEKKNHINDINQRLTSNKNVFNLASAAIATMSFPTAQPSSLFDWKSFGEALFWLSNIPNTKGSVAIFPAQSFTQAYKEMDSKSLSKLMLGMYSYSPELDSIRKQNFPHFISRIKSEFDIIHLELNHDEVNVHYIIDILKNEGKRDSNDFVVNILEILRSGIPDKLKFNAQGYGHRLQTLAANTDSTHKSIAVNNLPLEEWTSINACIMKLYEYPYRPENWSDFADKLNTWEAFITRKIQEFNNAFDVLLKGSKNYTPVIPVIQNALIQRADAVQAPKPITNSLGIYSEKDKEASPENGQDNVNNKIQSKYECFFKSVSEFKTSIENFIQQSAQTTYSIAKQVTDPHHIHDENIERLSQINLHNALKNLNDYIAQYEAVLKNLDIARTTKIEPNKLIIAAITWKDFLNNNTKGDRSVERILKLRRDFENKLNTACRQISKSAQFSIRYINSKETDEKPILLIDSATPFWSLMGYKEAYQIVQQTINNPEHIGLKNLMLRLWFENFYFIQTVQGKSINGNWNEVRFYNIKDKRFEEQTIFNSIPKQIDDKIRETLNMERWADLYPEFENINRASEAYGKLILLVDHLYDLRLFEEITLEESDLAKLKEHTKKMGIVVQESLQIVLDSVHEWIEMFPFDEETFKNSEEEQLYFNALLNFKNHLFPKLKGDEEEYELAINMSIMPEWIERLKVCTENWEIFLILLHGKFISSKTSKINRQITS